MILNLCIGSDDILYRLRDEQRTRAKELKLARASAYAYSTRDDDHVHELTKDAADEIERLRRLLTQAPPQGS